MELLSGPNLYSLMRLPGIGEKRAVTLATHFGTWERFLNATTDDLIDVLGAKTGAATAAARPDTPTPVDLPPMTQVLSEHDPHYPHRLRTLPTRPTLLWVTGQLPPEAPTLAVVGTRTPNNFGATIARLTATDAAAHHIPTVSGLALGCDSLAHSATMDAGLPTWAVIGQGVSTLPQHGDRAALAARILAHGGGIISEVPPDTPVAAHLLTKRNRLQTALTDAVLIAQTGLAAANKPAGTLHTVRYAIEQGRYLAVPAPPPHLHPDPDLAGNLALTDPQGMDPALIHATDAHTAALVAARRPVADLALHRPADLATLWEHLATTART